LAESAREEREVFALQALLSTEAPRIRLADYFRLDARRKDVLGCESGACMHLWNVWLEER
jgi:hypothetical protein